MRLEQRLEALFGFNRQSTRVISFLVLLREMLPLWRALRGTKSDRRIVISFGPEAYLEPLREVLPKLAERGWLLFLFPEWESGRYDNLEVLKKKYNDAIWVENASRALPFTKSSLFLSSVAGKHNYFPRGAKKIYYFHSLGGLSGFPPGGLDSYDYFLCGSSQQFHELKARRKLEGLFTGGIFMAGYPRYDIISKRASAKKRVKVPGKTLVYAPSFRSTTINHDCSSIPWGRHIIKQAVAQRYFVIYRPHPLSIVRDDTALLDWFRTAVAGPGKGRVDLHADYFDSYWESDIMVTDNSGSSVVFNVIFRKPVVFFCAALALDLALQGWRELGRQTSDLSELTNFLREPAKSSPSKFYIPKLGHGTGNFVQIISQLGEPHGAPR